MVDITAKLFWFRTKEWCQNMADKLNDIVYTDDSQETVDVINLLLLGWILLGLIVYIIGNIIATQIRKRKVSLATPADESTEPPSKMPEIQLPEHVPCAAETSFKPEEFPSLEKFEAVKKISTPTCIGDDSEIVEWINNVFEWLYNQSVVSPILESLLSALNARARLASTEHGILLDFKDVSHSPSVPSIPYVFQTCSLRGDVIITCDIDVEELILEIVVTQFKERDKIIIPFTLNIKKLSGSLTIECIPEDLMFMIRFSESPVIELSVEPAVENTLSAEEQEPLKDLIHEIAIEAVSSAIVDLRFSSFSECPKLMQTPSLDIGTYDSEDKDTEQLLVKIIKATSLGGKEGCLKPYCVVEMDEPPQKFETKEVEEKHNPFWDDSFIFIVKDISAELLFEIYDKGKSADENFLGLGIVSVEELIKNPSQRQIIPLQSRPLENDDITGSLTTEFLFLNQSTTPASETTHLGQLQSPVDSQTVETNSRVTAGGTVITTTTIKRTKEDADADLTGTALKELEKHDKPSAPSKSTLIIHSVQRPDSSVSDNLEASPASHLSKDSRTSYSDSIPSSPSQDQSTDERSRPKEKKSFIGTLRRRLSFRKTRSRSAEQRLESASTNSQESSRSASTERFRHSSGPRPSPFKSRKFIAVPGSTRSSISEASGVSTSSSKTYINEKSTLVIETNENGIIKRYLIPNTLIHRSKWKKRGIKLHIYNDHVFVAKHLSGSTTCQVCKKYLTRRPGKQGYECRGCNLQCHKSCHVKAAEFCPNSAINSMEVEYIQDPKNPTPKSS